MPLSHGHHPDGAPGECHQERLCCLERRPLSGGDSWRSEAVGSCVPMQPSADCLCDLGPRPHLCDLGSQPSGALAWTAVRMNSRTQQELGADGTR